MKRGLFFVLLFLLTAIPQGFAQSEEQTVRRALQLSQDVQLNIQPTQTGAVCTGGLDGVPFRAELDQQGVLTSFALSTGQSVGGRRLPNLSKAAALEVARSFVRRAIPQVAGQLDLLNPTCQYQFFGTPGFHITFPRMVDGIVYPAHAASVLVGGKDGTVVSYNLVFPQDVTFQQGDALLTKDQGIAAYQSKIGLQLQYRKRIYRNQTELYLAYVPSPDQFLHARWGTVVHTAAKQGGESFDVGAMYQKTASQGEGVSDLAVPPAQVQQRLREREELNITDDYDIKQAKVMKSGTGQSVISLHYENGTDSIDVTADQQGDVVHELRRTTPPQSQREEPLSPVAAAEAYLKQYLPWVAHQCSPPQIVEGAVTTVLYQRQVGGIPFPANGISFDMTPEGEISSLSFVWDEGAFPSRNQAISPQQAFDAFLKLGGLELAYQQGPTGDRMPVYQPVMTGLIDGQTGQALRFDGQPRQERPRARYVDLKDYYGRSQILALTDCGITLSYGTVWLDRGVRQSEYLLLLTNLLPQQAPVIEEMGSVTGDAWEVLYTYCVGKGILTRQEIAPDQLVTREQSVVFLLRALGYGQVAALERVYQSHFVDEGDISPGMGGYVELARALQLVQGSDDSFYPKQLLSNGEALLMVYNYLARGTTF